MTALPRLGAAWLLFAAGCTFTPAVGLAPGDSGTPADDGGGVVVRDMDAPMDATPDDAGAVDAVVVPDLAGPDIPPADDGVVVDMGVDLCGNSVLDAGESCDDGNQAGGDGCTEMCQEEPGYACLQPGQACVEIITASVEARTPTVEEGESARFRITLSRDAPEPVTVGWRIVHVDTIPDDLQSPGSGMLTIDVGQNQLDLELPTTEDEQDEGPEVFQLEIFAPTPAYVVVDMAIASTTIDGEDALSDQGVVLRYFLDERGGSNTDVFDRSSLNNKVDLSISQGTAGPMRTNDANRGRSLQWASAGGTGGAQTTDVRNTDFLQAFGGTQRATVELLIDVAETQTYQSGSSYLFWIGRDAHFTGYFTVFASANRLYFGYDTFRELSWPLDISSLAAGPHLLTLRFDSTQQNTNDRLDFFLDGVQFGGGASDATIRSNHSFSITTPSSTTVRLGNRFVNFGQDGHSFRGMMHYAALYNRWLDDDEIGDHYNRLIVDHDQ